MTKNLLKENLSASQIEAILNRHPRQPLLPELGSDAWKQAGRNPVARALINPLRERAIKECSLPMPVLTDELYASFRATGVRLPFERVYFERRRRLARAAISLLMGGAQDPAFTSLTASMLEKFTSIFEEESWALAAHVNWHNDDVSGKEPFQIDLFCAETANLMAEILDLFGSLIPPELRTRVRNRLQTHIFENYLNRFEEFHWTKATHNWNAVCHQGVIGSALSQLEDASMLARMLLLARKSLPLFLSGFTPDGGCSEGAGYWSYGFGWFTILNEQLETRTGGELSLFEGDEHIRRIAQFGPRMALSGGKLVNFADNSAEGTLGGSMLSYLGDRLNEPDCVNESTKSYRRLIESGIEMDLERCDVLFLCRLLLRCPAAKPPLEEPLATDCFLPDLGVLVAHGRDQNGHVWDFAAKAGHNDEHHNHNDCGGFLLNVDSVRLVAEIGAPEYVKGFFGPERYDFLAARSLGHSVPLINGHEQSAGAAFASRVVTYSLNPDRVEFVVDATACYPAEAGCRQFLRTFRFEKKSGNLAVHDSFELSRTDSLEGALIAVHPVVLEKGQAMIRSGSLEWGVRALPGTRLDRVEVHHYRARSGQEASVYRLVWIPEALSAQCTLGVEMYLS